MKNKIAIVTGASAGIGAATAVRLAKDFTGVVLVARRGPEMSDRRIGFLEKWSQANNIVLEEAIAKFLVESQIERYGEPEEIAGLIAFLVSPAARWMTGTALRMDGGEIKGI